ncbi:MAG TPA: hypothetical protein VMB03_23260 [Bryobacteraceae bacterium]|nr:hypothetical protein [Bryobacteraceae bacterium]
MLSPDSHAPDELLLMELEGELPARDAKPVRAHIEACWRCRARRQELERSIARFMEAYRQEFDGQLPPAAGPRAMLKAQLAQMPEPPHKERWGWFMSRRRLLPTVALSLLGLLVLASAVIRFGPPGRGPALSMPDRLLTPGATVLVSGRAVCSAANIKNKEVPASVRRAILEEYGIPDAQSRAYEVDYLVTPALGGSDDIRNLWPHSYHGVWNARVKDALEDRLRDMVCGGELDLAEAQREIAGDWIASYKKYFHTDRPLPEHGER